jgi:transposase
MQISLPKVSLTLLKATTNVTRAMSILKISWDQVQLIEERAVGRGLVRRGEDEVVVHIGVDEKSFLKGHKYASLAVDLDNPRVLDVAEGRSKESATILLEKAVPEKRRKDVKAGAMDMWAPFKDAWEAVIGLHAPIVHDKFHIAKYLSEAVDKVRRKEHKDLKKEGSDMLTKARYLFLKNPDTLDDKESERFKTLMSEELKVGRAWALKEAFRMFWEYSYARSAKKFFDRWYFRATHSRLQPIIEVAKMLKRHLSGLLAYCTHRITNAATEGLNSKIQHIKASARGFRNFAHNRIAILFHCGRLNLYP